MQFSVRVLFPRQHCEGPLHFLVATAVPFCPQGPLQIPGVHEDQPASPEQVYIDSVCTSIGQEDMHTGKSARQLTKAFSTNVSFVLLSFTVSSSIGRCWVVTHSHQLPHSSSTCGITGSYLQGDQPPSTATIKYI